MTCKQTASIIEQQEPGLKARRAIGASKTNKTTACCLDKKRTVTMNRSIYEYKHSVENDTRGVVVQRQYQTKASESSTRRERDESATLKTTVTTNAMTSTDVVTPKG